MEGDLHRVEKEIEQIEATKAHANQQEREVNRLTVENGKLGDQVSSY